MDLAILKAGASGCITMASRDRSAELFLWLAGPVIFILLAILVTTSVTATGRGATMTKFEWQASESAPRNNPMEIISGHFIYPDGGSLYVPNKKVIHYGWGRGWSSHVVGPDLKPLPNKLTISFFSYTENQFYTGSFDLPYEKILAFFQAGYYSQNQEKDITYDQIIAGVAPGGVVSVWISGIDRTTEVFYGQAEKEDGNWKWIIDNPKYPRDKYVQLNINESLTPDALEAFKKNGIPFGRWDRYHRARYYWDPLFTNLPLLDGLIDVIKYYNGEEGFLNYPLDADQINVSRAVPNFLDFTWERRAGIKPLRIKLFFDETEIFDVFDKLGKHNLPLQLEMRMEPEKNYNFTVWLRNEKDAIELKKIKIETYGIPDRNE